MRRLSRSEIEKISQAWDQTHEWPIAERDAFFDRLDIDCQIALPLFEILNPKIRTNVWVWWKRDMIKPEPITEKHSFGTQGLEGCFTIEDALPFALLLWEWMQPSYRINIFVEGRALRGIYLRTKGDIWAKPKKETPRITSDLESVQDTVLDD